MNHNSPLPAAAGVGADKPVVPAPTTQTRKRRRGPRSVMPPTVAVDWLEDRRTVRVPLQGAYGRGKCAYVDATVWLESIAPTHGTAWGVNSNGSSSFQICRGHAGVALASGQHGPRPKAGLARLITGAALGMCVWYRDRNPLNLRLANLEVISRSELMARIRTARGTDGCH